MLTWWDLLTLICHLTAVIGSGPFGRARSVDLSNELERAYEAALLDPEAWN